LKEALYPSKGDRQEGRYKRKKLPRGAFTLLCYVLMPNHFHLLVRQNTDVPISALMMNVFGGYAKCFNKKYDRVGSLFQDQFKSISVTTNEYLLWLSAYIHANPKLAGLGKAENYPFSSYGEYLGNDASVICETDLILSQFKNAKEYKLFVEEAIVTI